MDRLDWKIIGIWTMKIGLKDIQTSTLDRASVRFRSWKESQLCPYSNNKNDNHSNGLEHVH
jgi:hypothetical protein